MKENIEEDRNKISNLIDYINNADYVDASQCFDAEDISAIGNILSDHKRVLKENLRLRYQDIPYLEGEIKGYKTRIEELKKETEELAYRCRNLDQEAQGYLEALAGDKTLIKRNIKQLQEENEELKYKYDRALGDLVKSKQKIKDKIKSYDGLKIIDKSAYEEQIKPLIELLEE